MSLRQAVGLAALTGLRSMAPAAVLSDYLVNHQNSGDNLSPLQSPLKDARIATALKLTTVGEMFGDKMPFTPNRTDPMPVFGRAFIGAVIAASFAPAGERIRYAGFGALAAVIGAMFGYGTRSALGTVLRIPDPLLGFAEDMLVVATARSLVEEGEV